MPEDPLRRLGRTPDRPYVLDVWAPWCAPCRRIEPLLAEMETRYHGRVDLVRLNADDNPDIVRSLGVIAIPTLIVVAAGREIARRTGTQSLASLEALFRAAEAGTPPPAALRPQDRALRLLAAVAVLLIGLLSGPAWPLVAASVILFFSAVYDRCPIWQALSQRLPSLWRGFRSGVKSPR